MNNFDEFTSVVPERNHSRSGSGRPKFDIMTYAVYANNKSNPDNKTVQIYIGYKLAEKARFRADDRVGVRISQDRKKALVVRLTGQEDEQSTVLRKVNDHGRLYLSFPWDGQLPLITNSVDLTEIKLVDGGIIFDLPQRQQLFGTVLPDVKS